MIRYLFLIIIVFISGCSYKPTPMYTKRVLGDSIYAQVKINIKDPENSVLIKDAINEAIISKFGARIVPKKIDSKSQIYASLENISLSPIQYDRNGYAIAYKSKVTLEFNYYSRSGNSGTIQTTGSYDFPVEADSVISDAKRFEAVKFASYKAISEFISEVTVRGMMMPPESEKKEKFSPDEFPKTIGYP